MAKGEYQAETSRQMLLSDSFEACFTSPLARSRRTAEIIWEGRDDDLISDSDLREIDLIFAYRYCVICSMLAGCLWECLPKFSSTNLLVPNQLLVEMPKCDEQLVILISKDC
ncbi:hypothetical protein SETIT_6G112000v2 [Setaria italica]|uniref:Uncharacterized protein n=1 Tax=Setaria italica TaxID=4555 RepID=A0A368RKI5_SETIT|nr:hypothetical protein SETIT_6G112000v2 [Setaria italica]